MTDTQTARFIVTDVSVGDAGLTARPAVWDTVERKTIKVYRQNDQATAERHAAQLNAERPA